MKQHANDGKGPRQVFVDGRAVKRIVSVDMERGTALQHVGMSGRRRRLLYRAIRGRVEVRPLV